MKKLLFVLFLMAGIFNACTEKNPDQYVSEQAELEEKLLALQKLVDKYELPDSLFQNIVQLRTENEKELKELDLVSFEEQLAAWAALRKTIEPYQKKMAEWSKRDREKWAEINAESDPEKKAILEKKYWTEFFPKMKKASDDLNQIMGAKK